MPNERHSLDKALASGPWLLGDRFTMADVIVGSTVRWLLHFNMFERGHNIGAYADRLRERQASKRANAKNEAVVEERGLSTS